VNKGLGTAFLATAIGATAAHLLPAVHHWGYLAAKGALCGIVLASFVLAISSDAREQLVRRIRSRRA
jgi:hypothetical protein